MAILGIGLGVIFQGLAQGLRVRRDAAENVRLAIVAEKLLGDFVARAEAPEESEEGEENGVRWRIEALPARPESGEEVPESRLLEVRITIETSPERRWELMTLLPPKESSEP